MRIKSSKPSQRLIRVIGSVSDDLYKEFSEALTELERESLSPVYVELSSGGGVAYDALAFYSRIRTSPCEIIITGMGLIASAATLILIAGDKRKMAAEAWVMVHEDSDKLTGNVVDLERESKHLRRVENQWNSLFERHTKLTAKQWEVFNKKTTYLTAQECLKLGVIDEVI
jgi:ATP-dependent Clp protease protease subunit